MKKDFLFFLLIFFNKIIPLFILHRHAKAWLGGGMFGVEDSFPLPLFIFF